MASGVGREVGVEGRTHRLAAVALGLGACLYLALHLATLTTSRVAWFDDTFFSSVAESLVHTGELRLRASPLWLDEPVYLYGPVYFLALGGVIEGLGVGMAQARLPGVLCGFGILIAAFLVLRASQVRSPLAFATCALLALDPTFHQNIHAGRMDSMVLLFMLLAFYAVLEAGRTRGRRAAAWAAASGVSAALGVLTTPRPAYLLAPIGIVLAARWLYRRDRASALQAVLWGALVSLLVGAWVAWAFGGVPAMLEYYARFTQDYASGGFGVRAIHAPILLPLAVLLAATGIARPALLRCETLFFALAGIVGFYVFVKDKGSFGGLYSFFMTPLAYLALGTLVSRWSEASPDLRLRRWLPAAVFGLPLAFNAAVFGARMALELAQRESRDPSAAEATVARHVPPGSRVVGDDKFYFAVRRAGSDFQYTQRGATLEERVRYHRDVYAFDYLITDERDLPEVLEAYRRGVPLVEVATLPTVPDGRLAAAITAVARRAGLKSSLTGSYGGRILTRAPSTP